MTRRRNLGRRLAWLVVALILSAPLSARAANLTCSLPPENVPNALVLCESIRLDLRVRESEWTNNVCASYLFRLGIIEAERRRTTAAAKIASRTAVREALNAITETWPPPAGVVCGDGIVDREFGEQCDGGNGCNASCQTE